MTNYIEKKKEKDVAANMWCKVIVAALNTTFQLFVIIIYNIDID